MANKLLVNYCFLKKISSLMFEDRTYISGTYADKILDLKNPKLIIDLTLHNPKSENSLASSNNEFTKVNKNNASTNSSHRIDKKYKNNISSDNISDIKKNKTKVSKQTRKHLTIDQDDIIHDKHQGFFNKQPINISLSKSNKLNKKKIKNKRQVINHSSQSFSNLDFNLNNIANKTSNEVVISHPLSIQDLANKLNMPAAEIITYLFLKGIATTINQVIDISIAKDVAINYKFNILTEDSLSFIRSEVKKLKNFKQEINRAPIVTIFGHVDHGKTTLLDSILQTNLVKQEYGGITQAISGHEIDWLYDKELYKLVFLDTPGHEAFKAMRVRGAQVTDIALIVVAADDGLQPQTVEAINYILKMELSYIIVINKTDKKDIDIQRVKKELSKYNIVSQESGGDSLILEVSALKGNNIDVLLSSICSLSQAKHLRADPDQLAEGTILESSLDKQKGVIANIIIQDGTLKIGDFIIAGNMYGRVKNIINTKNISVKLSGPSSIVQILGFPKATYSGVLFQSMSNEKKAKEYINNISTDHEIINHSLQSLNTRVTVDQNKILKQLSLILKTDTVGSLEAIISALSKISQKKVQINLIVANAGNISSTDIDLASTNNTLIIGFNIHVTSYINNSVKKNSLNLQVFNVIYDLLNYIESYMLDLIEPEYNRVLIGRAVVQTVFSINKGSVAGCLVNEGKLKKMASIIGYRDKNIIYQGVLNSLKRVKEDVDEVHSQNECGLMCSYNLWQSFDTIEAYDLVLKEKSL